MRRNLLTFTCLFVPLVLAARYYDLKARRITTADGLPTNIVSRIGQDEEGFMWFETRSGLFRWDGYNLLPVSHHAQMDDDEHIATRDANWQRKGKGWLARYGKDGSVKQWQLIPDDIIAYTRNAHFHVTDVDERTEAISTYGAGLYLYDKPTDELTQITDGVIDNPYLTALCVDRNGCIWLAEDYLGVKCLRISRLSYQRYKVEPAATLQDMNNVRCLASLTSGSLVVGSQTGRLYQYDVAAGAHTLMKDMGCRVYATLQDKQGRLWIGTRGRGLFCGQQPVGGLSSQDVFSLAEDADGGLWVAMLHGGVAHVRADGTTKVLLDGKDCHDIRQDKNGCWWVAAEDSLYIIKEGRNGNAGQKYMVNSVCAGYFVCLCTDDNGRVWAGSIGKGLLDCSTFKCYSVDNGLASNNIYSLVQDKQKNIWAGTEEGLSRLNPATCDVQSYSFSESLLANVFNERTAVCLADGRLLFGTHDGIIAIDQLTAETEHYPATTAVTQVLVNGKARPLTEEEWKMDYTENNVTFMFSNFQYARWGSVLYQYQMEGVDRQWSQPTKTPMAIYRGLTPGNYVFRVRSNNSDGSWSVETKLRLSIGQPWWNTWWAWMVYLLAVLAVSMGIGRVLHLRRVLDLERRVAAFQKDFYDRIERELRNPVNVLQGATENVQLSGTSKTTIQSLRRGSLRMLRLMDMIREFHGLSDMQKQLNAEKDAMNEETEQRFRDIQRAIHKEEPEFRELAPPPANEQTILIVEDDEDNLTHLADTLNPYFKTTTCLSLTDCETAVSQQHPALVVMDITSDEKTARAITRRLLEQQPILPVVHLSSYGDDTRQLYSLRSGATDFLVKPFSSRVLVERIKHSLMARAASIPTDAEPAEGSASAPVFSDIKDRRFLERFNAALAKHVGDADFSVSQIAEVMGLGRTQLYKRVKELTGETPVQHLHRARLTMAARLLRETNDTIEDIMLQAGFHSDSHFYNAFRRLFGMSPRDYRQTT